MYKKPFMPDDARLFFKISPRRILRIVAIVAIVTIVGIGTLGIPGLAGATATSAQTPSFNWRHKSPAAKPPVDVFGAMAYDPALGETVLFGGGDASPDTWAWNGTTWNIIATTGPTPRDMVQMAYDAKTRSLVLFGGVGVDGTAGCDQCDDTWTFDGTWQQQHPANSPSWRDSYSMAYDPTTKRVVLAGGSGFHLRNTWLWNGTNWNRSPSTPFGANVQANFDATMTYDPALEALIYFGGVSDTSDGILTDAETWEWAGSSWTQLSPTTSPPPRTFAGASYWASAGGVVVFGGAPTDGSLTFLNDTWVFNGTTWTQLVTKRSPAPRWGLQMAPASKNGPPLVFGGFVGRKAQNDTWILDHT